MKIAIFERNKSEVKWTMFLETIRLNLEEGNAVFIGNKEQVKEFKEDLKE